VLITGPHGLERTVAFARDEASATIARRRGDKPGLKRAAQRSAAKRSALAVAPRNSGGPGGFAWQGDSTPYPWPSSPAREPPPRIKPAVEAAAQRLARPYEAWIAADLFMGRRPGADHRASGLRQDGRVWLSTKLWRRLRRMSGSGRRRVDDIGGPLARFWVLIQSYCWTWLVRDAYIGFEGSYGPT
jgi:hypothetical protein